jgi:hypothetical protein
VSIALTWLLYRFQEHLGLPSRPSQSSPSDLQATAPLSKGDLLRRGQESFFNSNANDRGCGLDVHNIDDYSGMDNIDRDSNMLPQAKAHQAQSEL